MIYQAKSYIKFLRKSKNQHAVHSPFVYEFVTQCLYDKQKYDAYPTLKQYRKALQKSTETIQVADFGKGSRVFKKAKRKVSKIAKTAGTPKKRQQLLFRMAQYFKPEKVLELGTSLGKGTVALSLGNENGHITTVEGCPQTAAIAKRQFETFKRNNIELKQQDFTSFLNEDRTSHYDFIFLDGHHDKTATLDYFTQLLPKITSETVVILDDIHWSRGMTEAWKTLVQHPKVMVSIDTFHWGILFFRETLSKEHFYLRM